VTLFNLTRYIANGARSDVNDAAFQTAYTRALKQSSRPFPFTELCLVGEGRAGKTALANCFCGRAFEQTESTIGVGVDHLPSDSTLASHDRFAIPSSRRAVNYAEEQLAWAVMEQLDSNPCPSRESMAEAMQVRRHASQPSLEDPLPVPPPTHQHASAAAGMRISEQASVHASSIPALPLLHSESTWRRCACHSRRCR